MTAIIGIDAATQREQLPQLPTKRHWRSKSRLEGTEAGLLDLVRVAKELELESMAIPSPRRGPRWLALGCRPRTTGTPKTTHPPPHIRIRPDQAMPSAHVYRDALR